LGSMWYTNDKSLYTSPSPRINAAVELYDSAARRMIKGISFLYIALQFLVTSLMPIPKSVDFLIFTTPIIILASFVALKLLPRKLALLIWQASFGFAIVVIIHGFRQPAFGLLLACLPFLCVITASWRVNLAVGGFAIGLVV